MKRITNFREVLSAPLSRNFVDNIVESVHCHPEDFYVLYGLISDKQVKISWRASWACEKLCKLHPEWFEDKQKELLSLILNCKHDGKKRILLSIIYQLPIGEPFPVDLLDYCFARMLDLNEPVAVQSLCLKLAYKLCKAEPDLLYELKVYLESAERDYYSIAVKTCIRNILQKLN